MDCQQHGMRTSRILNGEIMIPEQPNETTADPTEDVEIRWTRPEFWVRALGYAVLFVFSVAATPALIGMLIGHWWDVQGSTLESTTLVVSAALMPGFVITLRQKDLEKYRPHPYAFLMRLPKGDRFAMAALLIPTGVAVAVVSEIIERVLMLQFNPTMISGLMAVLLYTICLNLYGHRLASPRSTGG